VAPATAYTYFASKDHLVTEVFWRRLHALPETSVDGRRSPTNRLRAVLADLARLLAEEPELTSACTVAMLASDPDVAVLRERIGVEMHRRLAAALGEAADPAVLRALDLAMSGALVQAGMGHLDYADLPAALGEVGGLLLGERS
jgi:AcrR family transcriptional regulator